MIKKFVFAITILHKSWILAEWPPELIGTKGELVKENTWSEWPPREALEKVRLGLGLGLGLGRVRSKGPRGRRLREALVFLGLELG